MAAILIVEDDGLVAGHMARTLRQAGHTPILAPDAQAALQEARRCPDIVLLDLGLPDLPGEELLGRLKSQPKTEHIPVLVITGKREAAAHLKGSAKGSVAEILLKPVSGAQLREAVNTVLAGQQKQPGDAPGLARQGQQDLIMHLILEGSDPLVFHISRRLCADCTSVRTTLHADALTWAEIAEWGMREGLLDPEQARLLRRIPLAEPHKARERSA